MSEYNSNLDDDPITKEEFIKELDICIKQDGHDIYLKADNARIVKEWMNNLVIKPKTGRWIIEGDVGNGNRYCHCSECGRGDTQAITQRVPYCWWCGSYNGGEESGVMIEGDTE